jgi:hypothetical protein
MAVENIRGTASISQNEVNVKSFFEEIFGNAEAQTNPFVNLHSEKTFQPSNAQTEADVKDFFEFISELNEVNNSFGKLIDEACEAYFTDFVKPILDKNLCLTKKQTDALVKHYNELFDMLLEMDVFLTELNDFVAYEVEQRFIGKPDSNLFSVTSDNDGNIVITIGTHR